MLIAVARNTKRSADPHIERDLRVVDCDEPNGEGRLLPIEICRSIQYLRRLDVLVTILRDRDHAP